MNKIGIAESISVEFKSDKQCISDNGIIDAIVAFANTDGGELYIGVEDNGEITGLHKKHENASKLAAFIANKTVPPVPVRVEKITLGGTYIRITVPKSFSVVASSNGKIQRRRLKTDGTPENIPMYPYEISSRLSSLGLLDYSAQAVPDADYSDLDPLERERLRSIIKNYRGEYELLDLDDLDLDKALNLVIKQEGKYVPTFCGLLLIGKTEAIKKHMPTSESSIQIMSGSDIKVNQNFYGSIISSFEKINEYFMAWNKSEEMEVGLFRYTIPDYDPRAFREALVNAFCHRDYSILGRVLIQINNDGMTISNPGGFIEGITADNLLDAIPQGRNPLLATALKRIGLAERTGRGIDRIYEGSLLYGRLLPDYSRSSAKNVILFIPKGPTDKEFIKMISSEQEKTGNTLPIYSLLILNHLKGVPKSQIKEIATSLKLSESSVRVTIESLVAAGIVEAVGQSRGRYYMLSSKYYRKANDTIRYVRHKDIDPIRYEELVLELARTKGDIRRADVMELLHINGAQAYRILKKLEDSGKILQKGKGAGVKYYLT
ncbi:MAG: putative DNA binding domain-containing protein [Ruminococcus sp.]|uniref:RNA-binding domain-containing protein n=1 Tax=Ruminococcus sp. TaxID=41978 RepID=UPI002872C58A|nr:RNA-binding domain-containing protein [Ruminococcus sp.]MBQ3284209.1 putative DNA binding domain-containing protein [Ruminococcus sp.]